MEMTDFWSLSARGDTVIVEFWVPSRRMMHWSRPTFRSGFLHWATGSGTIPVISHRSNIIRRPLREATLAAPLKMTCVLLPMEWSDREASPG